MDHPTPPQPPSSKAGIFVVMGLLVVLIVLVIFVLMRVYATIPDVPTTQATLPEHPEKTIDVAPIQDGHDYVYPVSEPHDVANGVLVEQSPHNGNWTVTVRYPERFLEITPAFQLSYPPSAPWGLMRIAHYDATATDALTPGSGDATGWSTPYLSFFDFRASNYYAEGNKGMTFSIATAPKKSYLEALNTPGNIYEQNKHVFLGEDDYYVYLYSYSNNNIEVRVAVDELLKSFIPLNLDNK